MQNLSSPGPVRSRRSCEPCRRKKVRCDGGRPICSFCKRLKQECVYKNRRGESVASSIEFPQNSELVEVSKDRLQNLESQVSNLYGLLRTRENRENAESVHTEAFSCADSTQVHNAITAISYPMQRPDSTRTAQTLSATDCIGNSDTQTIRSDRVEHMCKAYLNHMHGQPLLLFEPSSLVSQAKKWPRFLLNLMDIVTTRFSHADGYDILRDRAAALSEVRREVMPLATQGRMDVHILQALCLLVLEDISESSKATAWMSIAIGARLSCMSKLQISLVADEKPWKMASWSLRVLDLMYCSSLSMVRAIAKDSRPPAISSACSQPPAFDQSQSSSIILAPVTENDSALRINECFIAVLAVWSDAIDLLSMGEKNKLPAPWADESPYRKIVAKLYDFETDLFQTHRVRHLRPDLRDATDLEANRSYWGAWFSVQILFHAVQAMINHPVLHIAGISKSQHRRPPSFLQHAVDELFQHSGWVKKLIDLGAEKDFVLADPFVAYVAAIVATGYMFFINSNDAPLARQAEYGFDSCYGFVNDFTKLWPHVTHTIRKLDLLRESLNAEPSSRAPSVQASLLWSLFDYSSSTAPMSAFEARPSPRLQLGVATQYLTTTESVQTPRIDELGRAQHTQQSEANVDSCIPPGTLDTAIDNDLSLFDVTLFDGFQPSHFGDDFFANFGQL